VSGTLLTNLRQAGAPRLFAAAQKRSMTVQSANSASAGTASSGDLLVWEASAQPIGDLTDEQIAQIGERVRLGANLLLTLSRAPGKTPMRMSAMLPTIAWGTQIGYPRWQMDRECTVGTWNDEMFPNAEAKGLTLPVFFPIRPLSAVERGEGRYERYERKILKMDRTFKPQSDTWTRSLLNRDWQVRVAAADRGRSPLLVTGSYGAGRVAVLAGSANDLDKGENAEAFWSAVLGWLTAARELPSASTAAAKPTMSVSISGSTVHVKVENSGTEPVSSMVVARVLTWEGALIGDPAPTKPGLLTLPPSGSASTEFALPRPSAKGYQALEHRHALQLRVGLLSSDGSTLIADRRMVLDLEPQVHVSVQADSLSSATNTFHAPDATQPLPFRTRMGAQVSAYAYAPGGHGEAAVVVSNALRNLAPLASVIDVADPKNDSVMALNDDATNYRKGPGDGIQAYSMWMGQQNKENMVLFSFPHPVMVASIVIVGSDGATMDGRDHNPDGAVVFIDGKQAVASVALEPLFIAGHGRATVAFPPRPASKISIRFPWPAPIVGRRRLQPWLGEIEIRGWVGSTTPPPVSGKVVVSMENALTGEQKELQQADVTLAPGAQRIVKVPFILPQSDSAGFYRLHARFAEVESSTPLLSVRGDNALRPITDILPNEGASLSFIVSRGFRTIFDTGTGTQEILAGWAQADDLIWAYSRQLKQIHQDARTASNRLYVTEDDMRHYSTPWKSYGSGEYFYDVATPLLVKRMQAHPNWTKSPQVRLEHSDRWDTGPETQSLHSWQDYVEFDRDLRRQKKPGLKGKTRVEIGHEIHGEHEAEWQTWHLARYAGAVTKLREAFAAQKKELTIAAQGLPIVAGPSADTLAQTIRGMADDCTWAMVSDSIPLTTGRQIAEIAYNPVWKVSTQGMYGYCSAALNNEHWHSPAATTEPSRRTLYDRAWRGMVWKDGRYGSVYTYGYNTNVGTSYAMNDNDWQQWWLLLQRHSLLAPEAPIGAGLVMSSSFYAQAANTKFSCGEALDANELLPVYARVFEYLHMAGVGISFGANASTLDQWKGDAPLILVNPGMFSEAEVASIAKLHERGVRLAAFGGGDLGPAASLLKRPGVVVLDGEAKTLTASAAVRLRPKIHAGLKLPIIFPEGTVGYGFKMGSTSFIVLEDWLEEGRETTLRVTATAGAKTARACNVNDHLNVPIRRDGDHWQLAVTLRPGDGTLFAIEETA
jgi:hypothetical protein